MHVRGKCHCGNIAFTAEINPDRVRICHCTDCQKLSGSPFRVVVPVSENKFNLLSGNLKHYIKVAESGDKRQQSFCPDCGTPIYATSVGDSNEPKKLGIRLGAIENGFGLVPKRQFWAASAVKWLGQISNVRSFDRQ
ncbi:GFA family protein [Lentilitoribacter sp. Alg239-R112]|uniref:GFA family protein n=1 Tax=Lentilitoribacter sp. Alg239-R112 TaxID=2305987 RepID=UPI0013A704EC|nr:GFA family protein [Lentilitoribacter sp. Alg239-R112]